jgi:hypothetical protein
MDQKMAILKKALLDFNHMPALAMWVDGTVIPNEGSDI